MSVSKFILPSNQVDADLSVLARIGASFAPHASDPLAMAMVLDPGHLMAGGSLVEVDVQLVQGFSAPVSSPRIDRVVVDQATGIALVLAGVEAAVPVAPALPAGVVPVAQVRLAPGRSVITNEDIIDERDFSGFAQARGAVITVQKFTESGTYIPTPGTSSIIVELVGGGGSGGSCAASSASQGAAAGGGSSGSFSRARLVNGFAGVAITVGEGGAAPAPGVNSGLPGGETSFGSLVTAPGGLGAVGGAAYTAPAILGGRSPGGIGVGANLLAVTGSAGEAGFVLAPTVVYGGNGGASFYGGSPRGGGNTPGNAGGAPGAGGGGASSGAAGPARSGGAGAAGLVTIYEFG